MQRGDEIKVGVVDKHDVPVRIGDELIHNQNTYSIEWHPTELRVWAVNVIDRKQWRDGAWVCRVAKHCTVMPK